MSMAERKEVAKRMEQRGLAKNPRRTVTVPASSPKNRARE